MEYNVGKIVELLNNKVLILSNVILYFIICLFVIYELNKVLLMEVVILFKLKIEYKLV